MVALVVVLELLEAAVEAALETTQIEVAELESLQIADFASAEEI